jgi:predicted enzyme related to lactoylglutathione lyase
MKARIAQEGVRMEMKLEVVPLPVSDPERSKAFYLNTVGFNLDHDVHPGNGLRVIQLTPPGSSCSVVIGSGMGNDPEDGTVKNLHLVVTDIAAAREQLANRGLTISDIADMGGVKYAYFSDPDGNSWALQEIGTSAKS